MTVVEDSLKSGEGRIMSCAEVHDAAMSMVARISFLISDFLLLCYVCFMSRAKVLRNFVLAKCVADY